MTRLMRSDATAHQTWATHSLRLSADACRRADSYAHSPPRAPTVTTSTDLMLEKESAMKGLTVLIAAAMLVPAASQARDGTAGAARFELSRAMVGTAPQDKVYGANVLTPAALAQCIANEEALKATSANLDASTARLEAEYASFSVQRNVQPLQAQNFKLAVGFHESELRRLNKNIAAFNRECSPKSYYADDYAAAATAAKQLRLSLSQ